MQGSARNASILTKCANTIPQMLSPLTDSGDNNVLMQSIQDYNQSLFEFVCLILLLFFTSLITTRT